jgi:hypothetical protein
MQDMSTVGVYDLLMRYVDPKIRSFYTRAISSVLSKADQEPIIDFDDIPDKVVYSGHMQLNKVLPFSIHNGQRKLFLNKLQFITNHLDKHDSKVLIVYAGAAPSNPGRHFIELFPNARWLLVDPNPFHVFDYNPTILLGKDGIPAKCKNTSEAVYYFGKTKDSICIINDIFTNDLARKLSGLVLDGHDVLFISDIRTRVSPTATNPEDLDIVWNGAQQYNWVRLGNFRASMLKWRHPFRMPYDHSMDKIKPGPWSDDLEVARGLGLDLLAEYKLARTVYFDGEVKIQPWAPVTSTETRLVVQRDAKLRDWGKLEGYEQPLFYYNTIPRLFGHFKNENANVKLGFDHCADCSLENQIWMKYNSKFKQSILITSWVLKLCRTLRRSLIKNLHGHRFAPLTPEDIRKHLPK